MQETVYATMASPMEYFHRTGKIPPRNGNRQAGRATQQREDQAFGERLPHDAHGSRAQCHAEGSLLAALHAANQHQVRHVGANNQQNETGNHHQDFQPVFVIVPHAGDACAPGRKIQRLLSNVRAATRVHLALVRPNPLLQFHAHLGLDRQGHCTRTDSANQIQPCPVGLPDDGAFADQERFRCDRKKEIGRRTPQRIAKEAWGRHSNDCEGLTVHIENVADYGRVQPKLLLPNPVAHHHRGACANSVVFRRQPASGIGSNAEHGKVVAGDKLPQVRFGGRFSAFPAHPESMPAGVKRG